MGDFKLVKIWEQDRLELFDLARDLSEENDLSGHMPDKTHELNTLLNTFLEKVGADTPSATSNDDGKSK
jgi:hypothetical protein